MPHSLEILSDSYDLCSLSAASIVVPVYVYMFYNILRGIH